MSTTPTPAAEGGEKVKAVSAFYADGVELFLNTKNPTWEPKQQAMFGKINGQSVSAFLQPAGEKDGKAYGAFLSFSANGAPIEGGGYEKSTSFGSGNVVCKNDGTVRLVISVKGAADGQELWAIPRQAVSDDLLVAAGLDLGKRDAVRAAKAAAEAANPPEQKAAARPAA